MGFTIIGAIVLAVCVLTLACAGALLVIRGRRGRKMDDHPHCRRCGFDLFGAPAGQTRCPECGAWIRVRGAIVQGGYQRRPGLTAAGATMLLLAVGLGGLQVAWLGGSIDLNPYKPSAWLRRSTCEGDPKAAVEWISRLRAGRLSQSQTDAICDEMLKRQADTNLKWQTFWGDLVEETRAAGKLDYVRWNRYLQQGVRPFVRVRPKLCRGHELPVQWSMDTPRFGRAGSFKLDAVVQIEPGLLVPARRPLHGDTIDARASQSGLMGLMIKPDPQGLAKMPDGSYAVTVSVTIMTTPLAAGAPTTTQVNVVRPCELMPADTPLATALARPEMKTAVENCVSASVRRTNRGGYTLTTRIAEPPIDLAFSVFLRYGGQEVRAGEIACPAATRSSFETLFWDLPAISADRVDVVFRGDPEVAAHTTDRLEYWDGEVVLRQVPVPKPVSQPSQPSR